MIELRRLNKTYVLNGIRKTVARDLSFVFPTGESVGLLGRNGAGKSSLLRMIAGTMSPDSGEVIATGSVSWPVGFAGSFHPDLTGAQNTKFVARIYGVDTDEMVEFVRDFAGLDQHFHLPVRTYSSGMRSRLAFGVSMAIHFDTYLIDEVTSVGDAAFGEKRSHPQGKADPQRRHHRVAFDGPAEIHVQVGCRAGKRPDAFLSPDHPRHRASRTCDEGPDAALAAPQAPPLSRRCPTLFRIRPALPC